MELRTLSLLPLLLLTPVDLPWNTTYDEGLTQAAEGSGVAFVAIHIEEIPACKRMLEVYEEKPLLALVETGGVLVASGDRHSKERCPLFDGVTCEQHMAIDMQVRRNQLGSVAGRKVVAPQHLFLDAQGKTILSVPFEVTLEELEWCFHAAFARADLAYDDEPRWEAKAPRALLWGAVVDPNTVSSYGPMSDEQVLERVDTLKRGGQTPAERLRLMQQLVVADHPEAIDFIHGVLRSGVGGGRGGGAKAKDLRPALIHEIGSASPPSYWEIVSERIDGGVEELQQESIVALEQLAHPESLSALLKAVRSEREPAVAKNLLRAVGAVGAADAKARKALLRYVDDKNVVLRKNALMALGFLAQHEDVEEALAAALVSEESDDQAAAALGLAFTREDKWIVPLKEARGVAGGGEVIAAIDGAIEVLEGGRLGLLREDVRRIGEDQIQRERIFGAGGKKGGGQRRQR